MTAKDSQPIQTDGGVMKRNTNMNHERSRTGRWLTVRPNFIMTLVAILAVAFAGGVAAQQQDQSNRIVDIEVRSNYDTVSRDFVIKISGLKEGTSFSRDNAAAVVRNLWETMLFEDVQVYDEPVENGVKVIVQIKVLPSVRNIKFEGFKEVKESEVLSTTGLVRNMAIGDYKIARWRRQILDIYQSRGFLLADVDFKLTPVEEDSTTVELESSKVDVLITAAEGEKIKIRSISIAGNDQIDDGVLKKQMETKENRWYRSGEYKEDVLEEDKNRIVGYYKTKGFRDAAVLRDSVYFEDKHDRANIVLTVAEGRQYRFGDTTVVGNSAFTEEELREHVTFDPGDIFDEQKIGLAVFGMTTMYNNKGYLQAMVRPVQYAHGDTVDVQFDIAESTISTIKRVIIEGNTKTNEKIIRREITLLPGEAFNRDKLERSYREIMALNFFDPQGVLFDYEPAEENDMVNIKFQVKEKSTGMAQLGAGYSERDRLVGTLAFSNSNLFGRGQSVNFNWDMGSRRKAFQVGFTEPWLFDTPTLFSTSLYNIIRSDYTTAFDREKRRGGYVRLGRELKWPDYSRAYVTYRLENVDYSNPSSFYQYYLVTGKTSSLSLSFNRDSTDLPQFASKGSKSFATVEIAGGPLGGDLSYYKYFFHNEVYVPLFWKVSLVSRTRMGYLKGYKESNFVPYSERFMPGGTSYDGIVRGYPNRQVGPRLSGEELGGETMFVNNFEIQVPVVANMVSAIAFVDMGNAWRNLSETNPFDLKRSTGLGVRVYVPQLGLIGFDFGYGFDRLEGTRDVGGWRTHFQFGNFDNFYY